MIDFPLMCLFIGGGLVCFGIGVFFGKALSLNSRGKTCESYEDILKREG